MNDQHGRFHHPIVPYRRNTLCTVFVYSFMCSPLAHLMCAITFGSGFRSENISSLADCVRSARNDVIFVLCSKGTKNWANVELDVCEKFSPATTICRRHDIISLHIAARDTLTYSRCIFFSPFEAFTLNLTHTHRHRIAAHECISYGAHILCGRLTKKTTECVAVVVTLTARVSVRYYYYAYALANTGANF